MSNMPTVESGICSVSMRRGWFGRSVLRVRRQVLQLRSPAGPSDTKPRYRALGMWVERDATRQDLDELSTLIRKVQESIDD